jgi:hypothetical protein
MSYDGDAHETRRNTAIAIAVAVAAVSMVGLLYWLFSSMNGPGLAIAPTALTTTATTSGATAPEAAPTTEAAAPPTIATWTPTTTFSLPPPEAPTMTVPADTPSAAQPPPAPAPTPTQAPAPPPPPPPGPSVSNVNLSCSKDGGRRGVTARLTFTTTTKIDVILSAGGQLDRKSAGPGNVSMTSSGRGADICFARIGDQTVGPIQAS